MPVLLSIPLHALLTAIGLAATLMPRALELLLGPLFGRTVLALRLFKRRTVEKNLADCFPEKTAAERAALLRANYEHYGILFFEYAHFFSPFSGHYARYAARISRLVGREHWEKARAKGKGVLFFSSHLGFWEMSAASAGLSGLDPTIVTTVLKPAWLDAKIAGGRASAGVAQAFHPGSMPAVLRALRRGGAAAFMNDQYAPPPMGVAVPFFGAFVNTLSVVGPLSKRTGAPVLPVSTYRGQDGVHVTTIEPEFDLSSAGGDAGRCTALIAARVEAWVRRHPAQWLWIHRRFKHAIWPARAAAC